MIDPALIEEARERMATTFEQTPASADAFDNAAALMKSFMYARGVDCEVHWTIAERATRGIRVTFEFVVPPPTCAHVFTR